MAVKPGVRSLLVASILWVCIVSAVPLSTPQDDAMVEFTTLNPESPQFTSHGPSTEAQLESEKETTSLPSIVPSIPYSVPEGGLESLVTIGGTPQNGDGESQKKVEETPEEGAVDSIGTTIQVAEKTTPDPGSVGSKDDLVAEKEEVVDESKKDSELTTSTDLDAVYTESPARSASDLQGTSEKTFADRETTTKAKDLVQEDFTSTSQRVSATITPDTEIQAEPAVGRILEKDGSSVKETTVSNREPTETVTESSITQPTQVDIEDTAATNAPIITETEDFNVDRSKSDVGTLPADSEVEKELKGVSTKELENVESPEVDPTLEIVSADEADKDLSVQTRADDGGTVGVQDTGDNKTSAGSEGNIGKVVSLEDLTAGDAKDNGNSTGKDDKGDLKAEEEVDRTDDKIIDLEEAERRWGGGGLDEGEEGSGSADEVLGMEEARAAGSHDSHPNTNGHHNTSTGHSHGEQHSHKDSAEDKENKKRTAIIVGVAVGGAALLTLGIFLTRQCKQKAKFTPLQKAKEQSDPEAIEFRPASQTGTALASDTGDNSSRPPSVLDKKNGLYRHGPSMGPPSPRFTRKAEDGKFRFPDSPKIDGRHCSSTSPAAAPLLAQSPAENGSRSSPMQPAGGAPSGDPPVQPAKSGNHGLGQGQGGQPTQTEGLYRQGPRMGPPSPRMHRKAEGKFDFPGISATTPSPGGSPTPGAATRI